MKKWFAFLLVLALCLTVAGCGSAARPAQTGEDVHKIGVIVYNTGDEEVIGFREYLQGYIEDNFEMVQFVYSGSITSREEELEFIQRACDSGAEGFLSFLSQDLAAEVALCEQNQAYYLLASGTVSEEDFESVSENPWFLGMFGPGESFEYEAGADMARFFAQSRPQRVFLLSGGGALGNEMHYQRTKGILETLEKEYAVSLPQSAAELARAAEPVSIELDGLSVTVCPGYVSREEFLERAKECYLAGDWDAVLSVLPPAEMASLAGKTPMGIVDSYNTRNLQLFTNGTLRYCVGKYSSMVGPAFALMLNAVTGFAEEFRDNGSAVRVIQGFWTSESMNDYLEKYTLSASASKNAYSVNDLEAVLRIFNPAADLDHLVALAEECSYEAVQARRG